MQLVRHQTAHLELSVHTHTARTMLRPAVRLVGSAAVGAVQISASSSTLLSVREHALGSWQYNSAVIAQRLVAASTQQAGKGQGRARGLENRYGLGTLPHISFDQVTSFVATDLTSLDVAWSCKCLAVLSFCPRRACAG